MGQRMTEVNRIDMLRRIVDDKRSVPGGALPVLHEIQDACGHIPDEAVPLISAAFNLSRAEVHGVISFYHWFREHPAGRHTVRLCRAEACQARGAEALAAHAKAVLGCDFHETSGDGGITIEPVYCLGQCACGPALMVDEERIEVRVTAASFDELVEDLREVSP